MQGGRALPGQVHLAHAQRGRPAAGGGGRAHPHRARGGRARGDLPPEGGGGAPTGRRWTRSSRRVEAARREGLADHRRHVHLHRGRHRLRRLHPALGARRRPRRALRAPRRPGDAGADRWPRSRPPGRAGRTSAAPGRVAGAHAAGRVQDRGPEAAHRQDAGRGGGAARARTRAETILDLIARGPHARRGRLLPDVRGQRAQADPPALGVLRLRRRLHGPRGRVPEVVDPPARLRQLRAPARPVRARREAHLPGGGGPPAGRRCPPRTWA